MPSNTIKPPKKSLIVTFKYNPISRSPKGKSSPGRSWQYSELKTPMTSSPEKGHSTIRTDESLFPTSGSLKTESPHESLITPPPTSQLSTSLPSTHKLTWLISQVEEEMAQEPVDESETFTARYSNTQINPLTDVIENISKFAKISQATESEWFDQSNTIITNLNSWKVLYRALEQKKKALKKEMLSKSDDEQERPGDSDGGDNATSGEQKNQEAEKLKLELMQNETEQFDLGRHGRRRRTLRV